MADGTDQTINTPAVLLTGASSQIGVFAIPRLVRAGFRVIAVSRKGRPEAYPAYRQVEWMDKASAVYAAKSCEYLLSAGPIALAEEFIASSEHIQTAIVFSSSSVESKQKSGNSEEKRQVSEMLKLESELQYAAENKGLKLLILRPTLIYGCGLDSNISRLANWIRRFGFMPVNGRAAGLRQPVHADDLASIAVDAMHSDEILPGVLWLTGGDTLSYSDMVTRIFTAMKKPVRLVRLPEWLFVLLIRCVEFLGIGRGVNSEMVKRQGVDLVFDDGQAKELLNYNPRPFSPTAEDFSLPEFQ